MKPLLLITLILCSALALTAQTAHFKFNQDGEFANLTESPDGLSSVSLEVARNTSNSVATANITYLAITVAADFSSINLIEIVGAIPPSTFTGQNTQNMALNLSTSQLDPSTSFTENCTFTLPDFTVTCGPPPQGEFHLQFQQNGAVRTRVLALGEEQTIGPVTIRTHSRSDNSTAGVTGTILGTPVSGATANVGIHHNSTLEFIHN